MANFFENLGSAFDAGGNISQKSYGLRDEGYKAADQYEAAAQKAYDEGTGIYKDYAGQQRQTYTDYMTKGQNQLAGQYNLADQYLGTGYQTARGDISSNYDQARAQLQPYAQAGQGALKEISDLQGLNGPQAQASAQAQFQTDPGYQFRVQQATQGLQRSAMSKGNLFSGNFASALNTQNQGMASDEYGNYYNRLAGIAGGGQQAAGGISNLYGQQGDVSAGLATDYGTNRSNLAMQYGGMQANSQAAMGNYLGNSLGQQGADLTNMRSALGQAYMGGADRRFGADQAGANLALGMWGQYNNSVSLGMKGSGGGGGGGNASNVQPQQGQDNSQIPYAVRGYNSGGNSFGQYQNVGSQDNQYFKDRYNFNQNP